MTAIPAKWIERPLCLAETKRVCWRCVCGGGGGGEWGSIFCGVKYNVYKKGIKIYEARSFWICSIDVTLTLYLLVLYADNFCKQFGPRSGPTKRRASSGSNQFDTQMKFQKEILKKLILKKNQQTSKKSMKNFPGGKALKMTDGFWIHNHSSFYPTLPKVQLIKQEHDNSPIWSLTFFIS